MLRFIQAPFWMIGYVWGLIHTAAKMGFMVGLFHTLKVWAVAMAPPGPPTGGENVVDLKKYKQEKSANDDNIAP